MSLMNIRFTEKYTKNSRKIRKNDNTINIFEKIELGTTPSFEKTEKIKVFFLYFNVPKNLFLGKRVKKSSLWHS